MALLTATYRLQFHRGFGLRDALKLVPYLAELGVSHVYASPLLTACRGSHHGYDVCDPTRLNPELGTEADLAELVKALRARNMGLVLDIVPNHMSASPQNPWWRDLLQHGRDSRFASYYDIDWDSPDPALRGKVLVPILGDHLQSVLQRQELRLARANGEVVLRYFEHELPVSPESMNLLGETRGHSLSEVNADVQELARFVDLQHYRLVFWGQGDQALNYRRFFNIAQLAAVRVEETNVFAETHARILQWYRNEWLDGLRVDHPDGLRDPEKYLNELRRQVPEAWLVIEKILTAGEALPEHWPVHGTTGYDFLNLVESLFVDTSNEQAFSAFYTEFAGERGDFDSVALEKKREVLRTLFRAEIARLARLLKAVLAETGFSEKADEAQVQAALVELAACFSVYRTYVRAEAGVLNQADVRHIDAAAARALENRPELAGLIERLRDLLMLRKTSGQAPELVMGFQQLTGPAMAKGVEDTAFYCFNRFVAFNEVGGNPAVFGITVSAFHESCRQALRHRPLSMLASSTHDTKRSEDVRARLALLSEIPEQWTAAVRRWSTRMAQHRLDERPDRNTEYLLYQTLVGAWPISRERCLAYMQKACREAKERTSWSEPNIRYEKSVERFVLAALDDRELVSDLEKFVANLADGGYVNSLAQTLLKLTAPGVPDIYQGTELWDFSLVDPDNRRAVDFPHRCRQLEALRGLSAEDVWQRRSEGLPKLWLIWRTLSFRAERQELFGPAGSYEALPVKGEQGERVVAFARGGKAVTLAPRLVLGLNNGWADTTLSLPVGLWQNELTNEIIRGGQVQISELLRGFPVALLSQLDD